MLSVHDDRTYGGMSGHEFSAESLRQIVQRVDQKIKQHTRGTL